MRWSPQLQKAVASGLIEQLRDSGLVDDAWYRDTYADMAASGLDAAAHYATVGAAEGRDPNAFFNTRHYLEANPDVAASGMNPLLHYLLGGCEEGRSVGPNFDTAYYSARHPEIGSAGSNPLLHYLRLGRAEGRIATPYDEADAFDVGIRAMRQGLIGPAATLLRNVRADYVNFPLLAQNPPGPDGELPLPPLRLAQRMGSVSLADFESGGCTIRNSIVRALPSNFRWHGIRCLDFGSGVGRALRHFSAEAGHSEFWGCDTDEPSIRWSVQNLSPPFRFFQISEASTIPFESDSFDLVYAVSMPSHVQITWHCWLKEICRILKPGGMFFASLLGPMQMMDLIGESCWKRSSDFSLYMKGFDHSWTGDVRA